MDDNGEREGFHQDLEVEFAHVKKKGMGKEG